MILLIVVTVGLLGALYYLPVFMQLGQGLTALESGLRILPSAAVMAVLMPLAGRLYDKVGPRPLAVVGFAICAYGNYLMHNLTAYVTQGDLVWWTIVRGIGMGFCTMPVMTCGIAALGPARVNAGSAWTMVVRQTSGAIPLAILSAVATGQQAQLLSDKAALLTPSIMRHNGVHMPDPTSPTSIYGVAGVFKQTKVDVLAASYADVFLITAVLSGIAALLALGLPGRPPPKPAAAAGAAKGTAGELAAAAPAAPRSAVAGRPGSGRNVPEAAHCPSSPAEVRVQLNIGVRLPDPGPTRPAPPVRRWWPRVARRARWGPSRRAGRRRARSATGACAAASCPGSGSCRGCSSRSTPRG
jgi:MFS family permease